MLTYVDTGKQVGDTDHLKVFADQDAAETWFDEKIRRALRSNMTILVRQVLGFVLAVNWLT